MVADVAVSSMLCIPILGLAFALGIDFRTGALGVLLFIVIAALWSLSFAGFGYAIALKTGNPAAVNSSSSDTVPSMRALRASSVYSGVGLNTISTGRSMGFVTVATGWVGALAR